MNNVNLRRRTISLHSFNDNTWPNQSLVPGERTNNLNVFKMWLGIERFTHVLGFFKENVCLSTIIMIFHHNFSFLMFVIEIGAIIITINM